MDLVSLVFIIFLMLFNTLLLFIKLREFQFGIIMLHLVIMAFTIYAGVVIAFPFSSMFGLFVSLYGGITFLVNVLKTEV